MGNKSLNLQKAIELLTQCAGTVKQKSTIYDTQPWGFESFNNFLNQVIELDTNLPPLNLLNRLLSIERDMGRIRNISGYQDRIIDLDILFYEQGIIHTNALEIPHPRLHERLFMLEPMVQLNPDFFHPVLRKSVSMLLSELS